MTLLAVFDLVAASLLLVWITYQLKCRKKDAKTLLIVVVGLFLIGVVAYIVINGFSDMMYAEQPEPVVKSSATATMDPTKAPTLVPVTMDPTAEPSVIPQPPTKASVACVISTEASACLPAFPS